MVSANCATKSCRASRDSIFSTIYLCSAVSSKAVLYTLLYCQKGLNCEYCVSPSLTLLQSIPDTHGAILFHLKIYCSSKLGVAVAQYERDIPSRLPSGLRCRSSALFHAVPALTTTLRPRDREDQPVQTQPLVTPDPPRASSSHPNRELSRSSSAIRPCYLRLLSYLRPTAILAHPN